VFPLAGNMRKKAGCKSFQCDLFVKTLRDLCVLLSSSATHLGCDADYRIGYVLQVKIREKRMHR
jgi:hypothetical protein